MNTLALFKTISRSKSILNASLINQAQGNTKMYGHNQGSTLSFSVTECEAHAPFRLKTSILRNMEGDYGLSDTHSSGRNRVHGCCN